MKKHWTPKNKEELARVLGDQNKFRLELGWDDIDLIDMLEIGLIEIVETNESGENKYKTTEKGEKICLLN